MGIIPYRWNYIQLQNLILDCVRPHSLLLLFRGDNKVWCEAVGSAAQSPECPAQPSDQASGTARLCPPQQHLPMAGLYVQLLRFWN